MKEIKAGEFIYLECPESSEALWNLNELHPKESKAELFVFKKEESQIVLGPMRAGLIKLELPCSDGTVLKEEIQVKALSPQEQGKPSDPLLPEKFAYPAVEAWVWVLLAILFIACSLFVYGFLRQRLFRKGAEEVEDFVELSAREQLETHIKESAVKKTYLDPHTVKKQDFYNDSYRIFRAFLEESFHLDTEFETTQEFLGTLRSAAHTKGIDAAYVSRVEHFFLTADRVRFASAQPDNESSEKFFRDLEALYKRWASKKGAES